MADNVESCQSGFNLSFAQQSLPMIPACITLDASAKGVAEMYDGTSWIRARDSQIGCKICNKNFGLLPRLDNLKRHAASSCHKHHLQAFLGIKDLFKGPQYEAWDSALRHFQKGGSIKTGPFGQHRSQRQLFCLAESNKCSDQLFLKSAASICLHSDVRKGRLMMRLCAINEKFERRCGLLGQVRMRGKELPGAPALKNCTERILQQFCTSSLGAPSEIMLKYPRLWTINCWST